jgi:hypothetical protein
MAAHAVLAARGEWVTNGKRLLERAGLRDVDGLIMGLHSEASVLEETLYQAMQRFTGALAEAAPQSSSARRAQPAAGPVSAKWTNFRLLPVPPPQ